jgi:hypothetical protein
LTRGFLEHPEIGAGGDFRLISGKSDDRYFNASGSVIADRRESSAKQFFSGAYIEDSFTPADNLELDLSVRADFFGNLDGRIVDTPSGDVSSTVNFVNRMRTATSPRLGL